LQYLYSDKVEEKKELIKGITLGNKDKFQLTPLAQVVPFLKQITAATHYHAMFFLLTQPLSHLQEVLVLWGEHDQIFPIEKGFEVARSVRTDLTCAFITV